MTKQASIVGSPCIVLTGAGASVPLGRSTTVQFIQHLQSSLPPNLEGVFGDTVASVDAHEMMESVDVEVVLDHLRSVFDATQALKQDQWFETKVFVNQPPSNEVNSRLEEYRRLETQILDEVVEHYSTLDPKKATDIYQPFFIRLSSAFKTRRIPFFTLNYDIAVETAADAVPQIELLDGINRGNLVHQWERRVFDEFSPSGRIDVILFKLHGSVSWYRHRDGRILAMYGPNRNPPPFESAILYPTLRGKNLESEPFKTAYGYFKDCLAKARVLIVIGTTLRDPELVQAIHDGCEGNRLLRVLGVGPSATHDRLSDIIDVNPNRVGALKGGFGQGRTFQQSIARRAAAGDLWGKTHAVRPPSARRKR